MDFSMTTQHVSIECEWRQIKVRLKDKVAIVTGSSKGIGEGIARVFIEEGAKVAVVCRTEQSGRKMADELGSNAVFIKTDLTKSDAIQSMISETVDTFGKLDILVNNAGYHISKNVEDTTEEEWEFIIKTNLSSTFLCSKYCIPHLRKSKGNIINISSMVGLVGQPNAGAYSSTKGGQIAMSRGMAIDFAPDGIRVNVICPGWIQTPLVEDWFGQQEDEQAAREYIYSRHPLGRIGTIRECGKSALFLACDEDSSFITGITLNIDGGITLGY
jgi:NAD(P)-dependent dehydrogenase (short-subunit alcohol dehydrogenase family)